MVTLNYRLCDLQPHSACLGCLNNQQYYSLRYLNFVNIVAAASVVHVVRGGSAEPRHDIHGSVVRAHCDTSLTLYSVAWFSHTLNGALRTARQHLQMSLQVERGQRQVSNTSFPIHEMSSTPCGVIRTEG